MTFNDLADSCRVPTQVYGITRECFEEYFINNDDKNDYIEGWKNVTTYHTKITWDDMMWRYQNGTQLDGYPFWAQLATYSGGGYVFQILCLSLSCLNLLVLDVLVVAVAVMFS